MKYYYQHLDYMYKWSLNQAKQYESDSSLHKYYIGMSIGYEGARDSLWYFFADELEVGLSG